MVSMGLVADTTLGVDAAGVITSVGKAVTLVKPGDRVATCVFGTYCNYMRVPQNLVQKLPDRMSIEEGASLSCVHITSYQCIVEVARLRKGETILIHSAAGGEIASCCSLGRDDMLIVWNSRAWSSCHPAGPTHWRRGLRDRWLLRQAKASPTRLRHSMGPHRQLA